MNARARRPRSTFRAVAGALAAFATVPALACGATVLTQSGAPGHTGLGAPALSAALSKRIATTELAPKSIHLKPADLPKPGATPSAKRIPQLVPKPDAPVLAVPEGFVVEIFAEGLDRPRLLVNTPDGDVLAVLSRANTILRLRDKNDDGVVDDQSVYLGPEDGLNLPFGAAFHQSALFVANTDAVLRYEIPLVGPAGSGIPDAEPRPDGNAPTPSAGPNARAVSARPKGPARQIASLPGEGYRQHWTRNLAVAPDGSHLFVTVGSETNVDVEPAPRAALLRMKLDGSDVRVFASGLRNPVGLDFEPITGRPFTTVNERDRLGDDLVPDYFTGVDEGDFFGWPYAYLEPGNLDPRRTKSDGSSEAPSLAAKTRTPDVLFQAHSAPIATTFYRGNLFPKRYRNGAFVAFRGSWNRSRGTGYKVVFIPFDLDGKPLGFYEDFLTGFLLDPSGPTTWARPVGLLVRPDGSLLVSDDAGGRIFRIRYAPDRSN